MYYRLKIEFEKLLALNETRKIDTRDIRLKLVFLERFRQRVNVAPNRSLIVGIRARVNQKRERLRGLRGGLTILLALIVFFVPFGVFERRRDDVEKQIVDRTRVGVAR